jgi:hypothetical protein
MDTAYDRIQEEALPAEAEVASGSAEPNNLNHDLQEAFKAVSTSPWGTALGGWFGQVKKQGENLYHDLQKEASDASEQATKSFTALREQVVSSTGALSLASAPREEESTERDAAAAAADAEGDATTTRPLSSEIVREAGSLVATLRATATARLKDLRSAEDAADDALMKFGLNVRDFLREAVKITGPDEADGRHRSGYSSEVLFETYDGSGKKIFHSTRLDAQLHAIHSSKSSFTVDPSGLEWKAWEAAFNITDRTEGIAQDLEKYEELKRTFEWAVPERADYKNFWMRYYFLRKAVDEEERRRKEVLKGKQTTGHRDEMCHLRSSANQESGADAEEEVGWGDDDDEEQDSVSGFQPTQQASESTTTLNAPATSTSASDLLKPHESRRSEDEKRSVADSDASYDMMLASGTTSHATGSPQVAASKKAAGKEDEDDEDDDWE